MKLNIKQRKKIQDKIKAESDSILSGLNLNSLNNLESTLVLLGQKFLHRQANKLMVSAAHGTRMGKAIMEANDGRS